MNRKNPHEFVNSRSIRVLDEFDVYSRGLCRDHTETGPDMQFAMVATEGADEQGEESFVWIFFAAANMVSSRGQV